MAFLSKVAFSMGDFLPTYSGREFADVDENTQRSDALVHRVSLRAGCAGWVPARHADSAPGERSVPAKDGVPARKPVAVLVLVGKCPGSLIIAVLKVAGGVLCAP